MAATRSDQNILATMARAPNLTTEATPGTVARGVRAEFRTALHAEIAAREQRGATSTTVLEDGRKLGRIADALEYAFTASSPIHIASDYPGELLIEGRVPLEAEVLSVDGLDVTVSVAHELGERVPRAILRTDVLLASRRLVDRIEEAGSEPSPAGDRLVGGVASGAAELIDEKLQTIGSIAAHLYHRGRSLLLVAHTGRAVDQLLLEISEQLSHELNEGAMFRLGLPTVDRLRAREDLLLDAAVWRRTSELRERESRLRAQRTAAERRVAESERAIKLIEWAAAERAKLADFLFRLNALHSSETAARHLADEIARTAKDETELITRLAEAKAVARSAAQARRLRAELLRLGAELSAAREAVDVASAAMIEARQSFEKAVEVASLAERERSMPPLAEQRRTVDALAVREIEARDEVDAARVKLEQAVAITANAVARGPVQRLFSALRSRDRSRDAVALRCAQLADASATLDDVRGQLRCAAMALSELEQLDCQLARCRTLGSATSHEAQLRSREAEHRIAAARETQLEQRHADALSELSEAADVVKRFRGVRATEPEGLVARLEPRLAQLRRLREKWRETGGRSERMRRALDADLNMSLVTIERLGLTLGSCPDNAEARFVHLALAHSEATRLASGDDLADVQREIAADERELGAVEHALAGIEHALGVVKETFIADARVIATTMTRLYMENELKARRFDTVIIDEATMSPIPALWVAARLADVNLVILGDCQRPRPITFSEHPLADKWLGRNIFDASGVPVADRTDPRPRFIHVQVR